MHRQACTLAHYWCAPPVTCQHLRRIDALNLSNNYFPAQTCATHTNKALRDNLFCLDCTRLNHWHVVLLWNTAAAVQIIECLSVNASGCFCFFIGSCSLLRDELPIDADQNNQMVLV